MATHQNNSSRFLWLSLLLLLTGCGDALGLPCVVRVAAAEVGEREATGKNDGVRVEMYLRSAGLPKGYPWCAAFVKWTHMQCGKPSGNAYVPSWFPKARLVRKDGVQSGDVWSTYNRNLGRAGHMGHVEKVDGNWIVTIEGNANGGGSREGDGVYRLRRLKSQIYQFARWV